jgi:hypothetical protein
VTTSGSVDFSVTRDQLITAALQNIGAIGDGDTPTATQVTEASILLNMLVKAKMADGMPLWALKTGFLLPQTGVSQISLGPSGGHATLSYTQTTLSAAAAASASTIVVTSATGFTSGYNIGIALADGTMHWTTINGAPAGTTITLTTALASAASSGAYVYVYQTKLQRPLRIIDAYRLDVASTSRAPINIVTYTQYRGLGNHTSASEPNQLYYDPQLDNGVASVYPRFYGGQFVVEFRFHRPFEDFDAASDTPDFPQEYYLPLMLSLSWILAAKNGVTLEERKLLMQESTMMWALALGNGTEEGSLFVQPDFREYRG